ncbi:hypothetical protein [Marinitenerispora sediminis]|uniref:MmgE/PrpD family protein n=1 Tax=Marinitenerispora sediminis TaxID=1931232 RepID=A0A368T760_9ACTN|nr:hypothetical protein [Marinitenerispora sediminis]RCV51175.1 hypothetical protein DEF23_20845 [Marinitenerispora sediminis]RCV59344.1 hypothetical protein DEF24_10260 [Marinitenerispora sediminis]
MHSGTPCSEIARAAVAAYISGDISTRELEQWMIAFAITCSVDAFIQNPERYIGHIRHMVALTEDIPLSLR